MAELMFPAQPLKALKETPSQTAGPYVHIGLTPNWSGIAGVFPQDLGSSMINAETIGERITVEGTVYDGGGAPVRDCVLEVWQADSAGLYPSPSEMRGTADPNFSGWGRFPADSATGAYQFETIKPAAVPFPDGRTQAPHISFWVVARGINLGLHTRMYFSDEADANGKDPILTRPDFPADRRGTLIGEREGNTVRFDIHLQGPQETVFFDI